MMTLPQARELVTQYGLTASRYDQGAVDDAAQAVVNGEIEIPDGDYWHALSEWFRANIG